MTHTYIGCDKIFGKRPLYFKRLSALEVSATFDDAITLQKLDQWRTESPKGFAFCMQASRGLTHPIDRPEHLPEALAEHDLGAFGMLRDTLAVRAAWDHTLTMAKNLAPKVIFLETPANFTPSRQNRAQLAWFAKELAPSFKGAVAWQPHGLWEREEAVELARELGLVPIYDPFEDLDTPPGDGTAYFRLYQRRGLRSKFDDFDMEELLERCASYQRAILIFKGTDRFRDARLAHTVHQSILELEKG